MRRGRVLYVTAARVAVYRVGRGFAQQEAGFAIDSVGMAALVSHVKGKGPAPLRVVADLADEDFHVESIPLLRGADRRELLSRRLRLRFPEGDLAMTASLGRIRTDRREERVVLGAFDRTQPIHAVLAAIRREGLRVAAIHSIAQLAPAMLAASRIGTTDALIVSAGSAGLRQTYVEAGRLRFSRLSALPAQDRELPDSAALYRRETARMHQYLLSSGVVEPAATVAVVHVAPDAQRIGSFDSTGDVRLEWHSIAFEALAHSCGLHRWHDGDEFEALAAYLAAASASHEGYADETLHIEARRARWRNATTWTCGALASVSLLATGKTVLESNRLLAQVHELRSQTSKARSEFEAVTARLPAMPTAIESLRAAERIETDLRPLREPMDAFLKEISRSLDAVPEIEVESVRWQRGPGTSSASGTEANTETAEIVGRVARGATAAELRAGDGARTVEAFIRALTQRPGVALMEARVPFGGSPKGRIAGDLGSAPDLGSPTFSVVIVRRSGT